MLKNDWNMLSDPDASGLRYLTILRAVTGLNGEPLYGIVLRPTDVKVWNGSAFEIINAADWASYVRPWTYLGGGIYRQPLPEGLVPGKYLISTYYQGEPGFEPVPEAVPSDLNLGSHAFIVPGPGFVGDIAVDHNHGGADHYRFTVNNVPQKNVVVRAYVQEDYDAGRIDPQPSSTTTGNDGRWIAPLMLNPGTYVLNVYNPATKKATLIRGVEVIA